MFLVIANFLAASAARRGVFPQAAPRTNAALAAFVGRNKQLRVFACFRVAAAALGTAGHPFFYPRGTASPLEPRPKSERTPTANSPINCNLKRNRIIPFQYTEAAQRRVALFAEFDHWLTQTSCSRLTFPSICAILVSADPIGAIPPSPYPRTHKKELSCEKTPFNSTTPRASPLSAR